MNDTWESVNCNELFSWHANYISNLIDTNLMQLLQCFTSIHIFLTLLSSWFPKRRVHQVLFSSKWIRFMYADTYLRRELLTGPVDRKFFTISLHPVSHLYEIFPCIFTTIITSHFCLCNSSRLWHTSIRLLRQLLAAFAWHFFTLVTTQSENFLFLLAPGIIITTCKTIFPAL